MARYSKKAQEEVGKALHEYKHEHAYKNRKQAIAVGIAKARKKGAKVPKEKN